MNTEGKSDIGTSADEHVVKPSDGFLYEHNDHPLLKFESMVEACDAIFGNRKSISKEEYLQLTKDSYRIDMEKYARKHNFSDGVKLAEIFARVEAAMSGKSGTTGRVIVIGCGQGRLAEVYISMAKKTGIKTIVQNDLIPEHVEATREKIKRMYGGDGSRADGVNIEYVPGDILLSDVPDHSFDSAYMWWYVGAEFCDPSSSDAMRENRIATYQRIHRLLIPGGAWIDDMPDPNMEPGLYRLAALKTAHILRERGILPGMEENLILSNWKWEQKEGFPYQLRWVPQDGADNKLKNKAGFRYVGSETSSIPIRTDHRNAGPVVSTIKSIKDTDTAIDALQSQLRKTVKFPKSRDPLQRRRIIKWFRAI